MYIKNYSFKAESLTIASKEQRTKRAQVIIIDKIGKKTQTVYNSTNFTNAVSIDTINISIRTATKRI